MPETPYLIPQLPVDRLLHQQQDRPARRSNEFVIVAMLLSPVSEIIQRACERRLAITDLFGPYFGRERIATVVRLDQAALFEIIQ